MALEFIQLDKNTGDKRLRDACQLEGIVGCELLPRSVRDETDDVVLEYIIREQFVTFTFDRSIHQMWGHILAGRNPGLIILRADDDSIRQINTKTAAPELRRFKREFPQWNQVSYQHSVVEITPTLVFVYQTWNATPQQTWWSKRSQAGWPAELANQLLVNAAGPLPKGNSIESHLS